jgi:hypothetical protein
LWVQAPRTSTADRHANFMEDGKRIITNLLAAQAHGAGGRTLKK